MTFILLSEFEAILYGAILFLVFIGWLVKEYFESEKYRSRIERKKSKNTNRRQVKQHKKSLLFTDVKKREDGILDVIFKLPEDYRSYITLKKICPTDNVAFTKGVFLFNWIASTGQDVSKGDRLAIPYYNQVDISEEEDYTNLLPFLICPGDGVLQQIQRIGSPLKNGDCIARIYPREEFEELFGIDTFSVERFNIYNYEIEFYNCPIVIFQERLVQNGTLVKPGDDLYTVQIEQGYISKEKHTVKSSSTGFVHFEIDEYARPILFHNYEVCRLYKKWGDRYKYANPLGLHRGNGAVEKIDIEEDNTFELELSEECYVYLMVDTTNNYHKIGISNNPTYRERTLQSEKPTIELIAKKPFPSRQIAKSFESALHNTFDNKRLRGEWFKLNHREVEEIKKSLS